MAWLAAVVLHCTIALPAEAGCSTEPVQRLSSELATFPDQIPEGRVTLCVKEHSINATIELGEGLRKRSVYSAWWYYLDQAANCARDPAKSDDLCLAESYGSNAYPIGVIGRLDTAIGRPDKELRLRGALPGFVPTHDSDVIVLIIDHGPAKRRDPLRSARQLMTPENYGWGEPQMGNDVDFLRKPYPFVVALSHHIVD